MLFHQTDPFKTFSPGWPLTT